MENYRWFQTNYLPSYYILAGFVFVPLSKPYISDSVDVCELKYKKARMSGEHVVINTQLCFFVYLISTFGSWSILER